MGVGERGGAERRMKLAGKPFPFNALITWSFSFLHSAAVDDSALARDSRLVTTDFLWESGWCDKKSMYLSSSRWRRKRMESFSGCSSDARYGWHY